MSEKPNVFIASSQESLTVAEAVNIKLSQIARVKQWDNAFELSTVTISSLIQRAKDTDYAVFVFGKDDVVKIREKELDSVRDNVLFELGLFIGALGLDKCFVLIPEAAQGTFRLPTDLSGVTMTFYDSELDDMVDSVTTSCAKIKAQISKQIDQLTHNPQQEPVQALYEQRLGEAQSQLWSLRIDAERAINQSNDMHSAIKHFFFSIAKPATPAEIKRWEEGAKSSYLKDVKIHARNLYYVDRDVILPSLHGASAISVIVAPGVSVFGNDQWSHNTIYYMDGFRAVGTAAGI